MQFYLPAAATKPGAKFTPRHFKLLADAFTTPDWIDDPLRLIAGRWAMVIRAPGAYSLGRAIAADRAKGAFVFDRLSRDDYALLEERDGLLLLDLGWEALMVNASVVHGLAASLTEFPIDPRRVRVFHCNQAARSGFEALWKAEGLGSPPATIEYPNSFALFVAHHMRERDDAAIRTRQREAAVSTRDGCRSSLFVSFNGEVRPHRLYLAAALAARGLLERGEMSLLSPRKGTGDKLDDVRERLVAAIPKSLMDDAIGEAARAIVARLPMTLDIDALTEGPIDALAWRTQDPQFYDRSRFSLVVDTAVTDNNLLLLTEKVLKPIVNHSPFLLLGNTGSVALMRRYGFDTFEPDLRQPESRDGRHRLAETLDEVERLAAMPPAALDTFSRSVADRCDANAAHFWTGLPRILRDLFERTVIGAMRARRSTT